MRQAAGFTVLRASPVNWLGSLVDDLRRLFHRSHPGHGGDPGLTIRPASAGLLSAVKRLVMRGEALYLRHPGGRLPWGHALVVLATKDTRRA